MPTRSALIPVVGLVTICAFSSCTSFPSVTSKPHLLSKKTAQTLAEKPKPSASALANKKSYGFYPALVMPWGPAEGSGDRDP